MVSRRVFTFLGISLLFFSATASASVVVNATVTPLVGSFRYDLSIGNTGPTDVVLVTFVDAPLDDALIDPSLVAGDGFVASYDPGLGFIDFIEDTALFASGTTTNGFSFESQSGPGPGAFSTLDALDVDGESIPVDLQLTLVPEPGACGIGVIAAAMGVLGRNTRRRVGVGVA